VCVCTEIHNLYSAPNRGVRNIVMTMSLCVCLSTIVSPELHVRSLPNLFYMLTYGRGLVLLWRRSDMLSISRFMDDLTFAHKPRLFDVAAQLSAVHMQPWAWL